MFDHYVHYQRSDPRRRLALQVAAVGSGLTTLSMVTFMWVADKLNITKVDAPTLSYVMVQVMEEDPAPPPPPPPPPPAAAEEEVVEDVEDIPDEEVPLDEIVQPEKVPDKIPDKTGKPTTAKGVPGGVPGGQVGGVPGGTIGGVVGGTIGGSMAGVATKRDTSKVESAKKPIGAVMAQQVYAPDPDGKKLQATKAGRFDKRPGKSKVSFCVSPQGKTVKVKTTKKFPGDPGVDEVCRNTVKKWRFKPFIVGGKPIETCSVTTFDISFD